MTITVPPKNITLGVMPLAGMMGIAPFTCALPCGDPNSTALYQHEGSYPYWPNVLTGPFRFLGNSRFAFNFNNPRQDIWPEQTANFLTFYGLVPLVSGSNGPFFGPQMLELSGTGMFMQSFALQADSAASAEQTKSSRVSMVTGETSHDGDLPDLEISRQQLLKRLREHKYKDVEIVDAVFGNLQHIPVQHQQQNIRIAFKMIEWGASIHAVAAALCLYRFEPGPADKTIQDILYNKERLERLTCDWSDDLQVSRFRSLMFLTAENIHSFLLLAAKDLIDLRLATEPHSDSTVVMTKKQAQRSFMATSWILKMLGYGDDGGEFEDLALLHLDPTAHQEVERILKKNNGMDRTESLKKLRQIVGDIEKTDDDGVPNLEIPHRIRYRVKRAASAKRRNEITGNYDDTNGMRIIVDSNIAEDCYATHFAIRKFFLRKGWKERGDLYRDYIARPKDNGYQSLHVGYSDASGYTVEIQIRTEEMDIKAETGTANHGDYKTGEKISTKGAAGDSVAEQRFNAKKQAMIAVGVDFVYDVTADDKEKILKLVTGSSNNPPTVLDFAFARGIDEGFCADRGFVDGRVTQLDTPLTSGQRVRVITGSCVPVDGRQRMVSTSFAKAVLAAAAQDPEAVISGMFDLKVLVTRGKREFAVIISGIESELSRTYGSRFTVGHPVLNISIKRLSNRMGFDDENMFYVTLAALPEGAEKDNFIAEIQRRIKTDAIVYSHDKGHLEIMSTGEGSVLRRLVEIFDRHSVTLHSMDISHIPGSPYNMFQFSIGCESEGFKSLLNDVKGLGNYVVHSESRSSSSLDIEVRIRQKYLKPKIVMDTIRLILNFGAEIRACSVPKDDKGSPPEYSFKIQLPPGLSKKRRARALATMLGNIQGVGQIVIL